MKIPEKKPIILFLTSYPPRPCGIATFSQDLIRAIENKFGASYEIKVCALENNTTESYNYDEHVIYRLNTESLSQILACSAQINKNERIKLISVQFEFGLWGNQGQQIIDFLQAINKPVFSVFHTVLPAPGEKQLKVVRALNKYSKKLVVMTNRSKALLKRVYKIPNKEITLIPHGTHPIAWDGQHELKQKYGLKNNLVLSTFGLLGPNKNIETSLCALSQLVKAFPEIKFLILGRTHPELVKQSGESYRESLEKLVKDLRLEKHVIFINKYLPLQELLEYLKLTDIYLFSSKDPNQAVSGTFVYAMSCGCPIVSTPISHALEMLDDSLGVLFDFEDVQAMAMGIKPLLTDKLLRTKLALNAYQKTRSMIWENVAIAYFDVIRHVIPQYEVSFKKPPVNLNHIKGLTNEFGIIQFSKIAIPDISTGYTIDDNARALIAMVMHYVSSGEKEDLAYISTYLDFIEYCQSENGEFQNYVDEDKSFHKLNKHVNLEDSNARVIWALGYLISNTDNLPQALVEQSGLMLRKTAPWLDQIGSPRAIALIIKGLYYYNQQYASPNIKKHIESMADKLVSRFVVSSENDWVWFENYLTYANSVLPEALIYAYDITQKPVYKSIAIASFDFLINHTFKDDYLQVISNRGWKHNGQESEEYGEQPIDVAYTVQTLHAFYNILGSNRYKLLMEKAFTWFLGNNQLRQTVYDPTTGGCHDGLEKAQVNLNQGAESTVCYLIARLTMEQHKIRILELT